MSLSAGIEKYILSFVSFFDCFRSVTKYWAVVFAHGWRATETKTFTLLSVSNPCRPFTRISESCGFFLLKENDALGEMLWGFYLNCYWISCVPMIQFHLLFEACFPLALLSVQLRSHTNVCEDPLDFHVFLQFKINPVVSTDQGLVVVLLITLLAFLKSSLRNHKTLQKHILYSFILQSDHERIQQHLLNTSSV